MLIFDIGANNGDFTEACLKQFADTKVISVEPINSLATHLSQRFNLNSVTVLNLLVSDIDNASVPFYESATSTISTASTDWIHTSRFANSHRWGAPINKKTTTLDKMIETFGIPDLVKIDVEGYELSVIRGLSRKINKLCFEWAEEQKMAIITICDYLENLGYGSFGYILKDEYLKEPSTWMNKIDLLQAMNLQPERKTEWGMIWVR